MNKQTFSVIFWSWIPLAFVTTLLCFLSFILVAQAVRKSADDPQIELARNAVDSFSASDMTEYPTLPAVTDMTKSLSSYVMLFDDSGALVTTSATVAGGAPSLPEGVLEAVRKKGEHRMTWEPQKGSEQALVILKFEGAKPGFVAMGRSLEEVNKRVTALQTTVLIVWIVSLVASFFLYFAIFRFRSRKS